ncbi:MAG: hypothetical protein MI749_16970, partial [Desulfovibrionales bacterium]|nr:hypothetical protein [Desulfovibrionales bacterium]
SMALKIIIRAVIDRKRDLKDEKEWTAQHLALVANAIGKVESKRATRALVATAGEVADRKWDLKDKTEWTAQSVALVANAISKVEGNNDVTRALNIIADAVIDREQDFEDNTEWTAQGLSMVATGLRYSGNSRAFELVIDRLVTFAGQEPLELAWLLSCMSGWHLVDEHLRAGLKLYKALEEADYRPDSLRTVHELIWSATVMHFVSTEMGGSEGDDSRTDLFRKYYQNYRNFAEGNQERNGSGTVFQDRWHGIFARDYWEPEQSEPGLVIEFQEEDRDISKKQRQVYQKLREIYDSCYLEVSINQFPVDILLDGRVCVEVDGPQHYVKYGAGAVPGEENIEGEQRPMDIPNGYPGHRLS